MSLSLNNRIFIPIENSEGGVVDERTQFHFSQTGVNFTAEYQGGDILTGHIIGRLTDHLDGEMLYHCLTKADELKAGYATATFQTSPTGDIRMSLNWEWLNHDDGSNTVCAGKSEYISTNTWA